MPARSSASKQDIRRFVKEKRSDLDPMFVERASLAAQKRVVALPEFRVAAVVCCYLSMAGEVRTDRILDACWKEGKRVCAPTFHGKTGKYRLAEIGKDMPLIEGHWKVREPARKDWMAIKNVDLIVVPGVAFDRRGGRVGHGGGYYDKILADANGGHRCLKVGLAFEFQVFESVPMSDNDVRMNMVVTEKSEIRCG